MAESQERIATATAEELPGSDNVLVTCLVDGLQVKGMISKSPKNATVSVKFAEQGFDMTAKMQDTTFRKVVRKLPGKIQKDSCTWKVDKGKVKITLLKEGSESWAVQLSQRGLEQKADEEDE